MPPDLSPNSARPVQVRLAPQLIAMPLFAVGRHSDYRRADRALRHTPEVAIAAAGAYFGLRPRLAGRRWNLELGRSCRRSATNNLRPSASPVVGRRQVQAIIVFGGQSGTYLSRGHRCGAGCARRRHSLEAGGGSRPTIKAGRANSSPGARLSVGSIERRPRSGGRHSVLGAARTHNKGQWAPIRRAMNSAMVAASWLPASRWLN